MRYPKDSNRPSEFPIVVCAEPFEYGANAKLKLPRRSALFRAQLRGFHACPLRQSEGSQRGPVLNKEDEVCSSGGALAATAAPDLAPRFPEQASEWCAVSSF